MRLIKNKTALDSMIIYDNNIRDYMLEVDGLLRLFDSYNDIYFRTLDVQRKIDDLKFHTPGELTALGKNYLITKDPEKIAWFRNMLKRYQITCNYNSGRELKIKQKAINLIRTLQNEYHIE